MDQPLNFIKMEKLNLKAFIKKIIEMVKVKNIMKMEMLEQEEIGLENCCKVKLKFSGKMDS